jgi:catechol 2,3-dioxygenase-like lactoylglutathione lyase family enzyme
MDISTQHYGIYTDDIDASLAFYTDILGFTHLFSSEADEAGIPLKMAWIRNDRGIVIELLQQANYNARAGAEKCRNHVALRVDDMDATVAALKAAGVELETEPFDPPLDFDRPLPFAYRDTFAKGGERNVQLRVAFFRGPFGERFELMQDNIGPAVS